MKLIVKFALLITALALSVTLNPLAATADASIETQTYESTWDSLPQDAQLVVSDDGRALLATKENSGDYQSGITSELKVSRSSANPSELDQTATAVSGYYDILTYNFVQLEDGSLVITFQGLKYVRHIMKMDLGYVISGDSGATWSAPVLLESGNNDIWDFVDLLVLQDSSGKTYLINSDYEGIVSYWRTDDIESGSWTYVESDDSGFLVETDVNFGTFWSAAKLHTLDFSKTSTKFTLTEKTYSGLASTFGLQKSDKLLNITGKSPSPAWDMNRNGDAIAAATYYDKYKKTKMAYRLFDETTQTWSEKKTVQLVANKKVSSLWTLLADDGSFAILYNIGSKQYVRTFDSAGVMSAASKTADALGPGVDQYYELVRYNGAGDFTFAYEQQVDEDFVFVVRRGQLNNLTKTTETQLPEDGISVAGRFGYYFVFDTGVGIDEGDETPNTVQVKSFAIAPLPN